MENSSRILHAPTPKAAKDIADKLDTVHTKWPDIKVDVIYELLENTCKLEQCPAMEIELMETSNCILIEDTNHDFWARGLHNNGQNMLGRLLMTIRDEMVSKSETMNNFSSQSAYRPPVNVSFPCYLCGEGNHNKESCRHSYPVQCHQCSFTGHKKKNCPGAYY